MTTKPNSPGDEDYESLRPALNAAWEALNGVTETVPDPDRDSNQVTRQLVEAFASAEELLPETETRSGVLLSIVASAFFCRVEGGTLEIEKYHPLSIAGSPYTEFGKACLIADELFSFEMDRDENDGFDTIYDRRDRVLDLIASEWPNVASAEELRSALREATQDP